MFLCNKLKSNEVSKRVTLFVYIGIAKGSDLHPRFLVHDSYKNTGVALCCTLVIFKVSVN